MLKCSKAAIIVRDLEFAASRTGTLGFVHLDTSTVEEL
jgi:hypothetical protein